MGKKTHGNCEVSYCCCPVAKSYLTLRHNGLQHARLPCPSVPTGICSNSCPLSQWCHPTISSSVASFSSCPPSFTASRSFLRSRLFASGGQSIGASVSASVLPMNVQGWFPLRLTALISLLFKGISRVFSSTTVRKKASILWHSAFFMVQLSHLYMTTGKNYSFDHTDHGQQSDISAF